jgi:hypothetical protein
MAHQPRRYNAMEENEKLSTANDSDINEKRIDSVKDETSFEKFVDSMVVGYLGDLFCGDDR